MNAKLKRAVAIIALILIIVFTVSLIIYLFDKTLLNGAIGDLAIWSGAFGLLLSAVLWIMHAFPSQQVKDEERNKIYSENLDDDSEKEARENAETEETRENADSDDGEVQENEASDDEDPKGEDEGGEEQNGTNSEEEGQNVATQGATTSEDAT